MSEIAPGIYVLHGEDELASSEFLQSLEAQAGEPTIADINITRLDGRTFTLDEFINAASAMPFLAKHRLIILTHPIARLQSSEQRDKFIKALEKFKTSAVIVLYEDHPLTSKEELQQGKRNWLEKWALEKKSEIVYHNFTSKSMGAMTQWILERTRSLGGQISRPAAASLAALVGGDSRMAQQEISKLLAYVNYKRQVEIEDVNQLSPASGVVEDFALVNAIRSKNARLAQSTLHKMLVNEEPLRIFQQIIGQFRTLIQAREILDQGGNQADIIRLLGIHEYTARLASEHARHISIQMLDSIYHTLLDLDEAIKTGQMEAELALDLLVIQLTR